MLKLEKRKYIYKVLDDGEVVLSKLGVIIGFILLPVYLFGLSIAIEFASILLYKRFGFEMTDLQFNMVFYIIMLAVVIGIYGRYIWASIKRAFSQRPRWMWIVTLYLGFLGIFSLNMVSQVIIGMFERDMTSVNQDTAVSFAENSLGFMFFMSCICAPIIEELFFRGVLFRPFARGKVSAVIACLVSAVLFASIHVVTAAIANNDPGELLYLIGYLPQGIVLAVCCYKTKNIAGSMLLHFANNLLAIMMIVNPPV